MADFATTCELTARAPTADGSAAAATLSAAQAAVLAYLGYDPRAVRAVEHYDGTGTPFLAVRRPVGTIHSLYEQSSGVFDPDDPGTLLAEGEDFAVRSSFVLERIGRAWPVQFDRPPGRLAFNQNPARRCVTIDMTASGDPGLLGVCKEATLSTAAALWSARPSGMGVQLGESVDGVSVTFAQLQLGSGVAQGMRSPVAQMMLRPFRRPAIGGL